VKSVIDFEQFFYLLSSIKDKIVLRKKSQPSGILRHQRELKKKPKEGNPGNTISSVFGKQSAAIKSRHFQVATYGR